MCLRGVAALGLRDRCEKHREMDFAVRIVGIGEDIVAPDHRIPLCFSKPLERTARSYGLDLVGDCGHVLASDEDHEGGFLVAPW